MRRRIAGFAAAVLANHEEKKPTVTRESVRENESEGEKLQGRGARFPPKLSLSLHPSSASRRRRTRVRVRRGIMYPTAARFAEWVPRGAHHVRMRTRLGGKHLRLAARGNVQPTVRSWLHVSERDSYSTVARRTCTVGTQPDMR